MAFIDALQAYRELDTEAFFAAVEDADVLAALAKPRLDAHDYLTLLSPKAQAHLEAMAQRANRETIRQFGRTMQLFTPLYIANYCVNRCVYCGFNHESAVARRKLTLAEIRAEGAAIAATGLRHVLVLTGESMAHSPLDYILEAVAALRGFFASVSIEIYPLTEADYARCRAADVDGMTLFQETYDPAAYARLHLAGPKRDYAFRLDAPERACRAGLRSVNIGALLGLFDWRKDAFCTGLHAAYLQRAYGAVEIAASVPRLRPSAGGFPPPAGVRDRDLVQYIAALRLFLPRCGITVSSRESAALRDRLARLGATKMSAGVTTAVGGHTRAADSEQFAISDERSVAEMAAMLCREGYQPVFKDWQDFA